MYYSSQRLSVGPSARQVLSIRLCYSKLSFINNDSVLKSPQPSILEDSFGDSFRSLMISYDYLLMLCTLGHPLGLAGVLPEEQALLCLVYSCVCVCHPSGGKGLSLSSPEPIILCPRPSPSMSRVILPGTSQVRRRKELLYSRLYRIHCKNVTGSKRHYCMVGGCSVYSVNYCTSRSYSALKRDTPVRRLCINNKNKKNRELLY
jgi:hypothetical protein